MKKMRQNKKVINKGFTLVELIAVIIIISVISIMSFASMTKTLKNSQIKEIEVFETNLKTAAQMYIETNLKDFPQLDDVGGSVQITTLDLISKGYIDEDIDNPSDCSTKDSYILAKKQPDNTIEYTVSCVGDSTEEPPTTPDFYVNGTAVYFNPETGTKCTAGQAVSTPGTKTGCMKWYAFNDGGSSSETINLLLDHNTTAFAVWGSVNDFVEPPLEPVNFTPNNNTKAELVSEPTAPTNISGPDMFTFFMPFENDTSSWAGVPTRTDSYSLSNGIADYTIDYNTYYKARLITAAEIATITGNSSFEEQTAIYTDWFYLDSKNQTQTATTTGASNYRWLFDYTSGCTVYGCSVDDASTSGYWTATATAGGTTKAWIMDKTGKLSSYAVSSNSYAGIRPVITIPKSSLK